MISESIYILKNKRNFLLTVVKKTGIYSVGTSCKLLGVTPLSTKHPRIGVHLDLSTLEELSFLARIERKSLSDIAQALILQALELRGDGGYSPLAESRDVEGATRISHEEAWKPYL